MKKIKLIVTEKDEFEESFATKYKHFLENSNEQDYDAVFTQRDFLPCFRLQVWENPLKPWCLLSNSW